MQWAAASAQGQSSCQVNLSLGQQCCIYSTLVRAGPTRHETGASSPWYSEVWRYPGMHAHQVGEPSAALGALMHAVMDREPRVVAVIDTLYSTFPNH